MDPAEAPSGCRAAARGARRHDGRGWDPAQVGRGPDQPRPMERRAVGGRARPGQRHAPARARRGVRRPLRRDRVRIHRCPDRHQRRRAGVESSRRRRRLRQRHRLRRLRRRGGVHDRRQLLGPADDLDVSRRVRLDRDEPRRFSRGAAVGRDPRRARGGRGKPELRRLSRPRRPRRRHVARDRRRLGARDDPGRDGSRAS